MGSPAWPPLLCGSECLDGATPSRWRSALQPEQLHPLSRGITHSHTHTFILSTLSSSTTSHFLPPSHPPPASSLSS